MKRWLLVSLLIGSGSVLFAQQGPVFDFEFTNDKLTPAHWELKLNPDGSGRFDAVGGAPATGDGKEVETGDIHRPVQLSAAFTDRIFATARARRLFAFPCDGHQKVAFQGMKKLSYSGPEGSGSCEYNYSKDKEIQALGDSILGVEGTLLFGARLEQLMQHDRLGLDLEMEHLVTAAHEGNALELGTIRETLTKIANDDQILDRARRKARLLLAQNQ